MIRLLVISILIAAIFQKDKKRTISAFIFSCVTLLHEIFMKDLDGFLYYGSAALFDLAIIIIFSKMESLSYMVIRLQKVCIVSMFVNIIGWMMWYMYYPPDIYNISFMFLYLWTIAILLEQERLFDVGINTMGGLPSCFSGHAAPGN